MQHGTCLAKYPYIAASSMTEPCELSKAKGRWAMDIGFALRR
jgi:hypothetical protein